MSVDPALNAESVVDTDMLRRAAKACRSFRNQPPGASRDWFDWVPKYLEQLADKIDQEDRTDGS